MKKIIGITGYANTGKDTLTQMIIETVEKRGFLAKRFSIGDIIKQNLRPVFEPFGIDPLTCSREDKEKIRDILVHYGIFARNQSNGRCFIDQIQTDILKDPCDIAIVSDIRFCEYEHDELPWLLEEMGGILFNVQRYKLENYPGACANRGMCISHYPPGNSTEEKNGKLIKEYIEKNRRELQVIDWLWKDFAQPKYVYQIESVYYHDLEKELEKREII